MPRNVLFICTQNRLRSPTAEQVFAEWPGVETASAGLGNDAEVPVSPELLAWADTVFVMEKVHRSRLSAKFGRHLNGKRVICLDIPHDYDFMDPMLIRLLKQKVARFLPTNVVTS
ncbi:MAG: low molecular weight protein tyrosine phosphatase family protein [Pseudoxanthomonas sp.]|nr:low molecular weight protein tyrosine phosphatase family protein [Pseudoxanthomonas sp.]